MSKYSTGSLVNALRERLGLEREAILELSLLDDSSLRRIESEKQNPKIETFEVLIKAVNIPPDGFIYSKLGSQPMEANFLYNQLSKALELNDINKAEKIIAKLEYMPGFDSGIPLQFMLSKKAHLWDLHGKPPKQIIPIIDEAIGETFQNVDINTLESKVLILEEPELLHTKAKVYVKMGELDRAVKILEQMVSGMKNVPVADEYKEKQYAPLLLTLSNLLIKTGDYSKVLEVCDIGAEYSAKQRRGQMNPDFEVNRAKALFALDRTVECKGSLKQAYFGYMLLGEVDKAQNVLTIAQNNFNIEFNLYGVDKIITSQQGRISYLQEEAISCNNLGEMIRILRDRANLSLSQLSEGICNKSTLMRIEKGELNVNYFILEAIMQRLGRNISQYINFFLKRDEFIAIQLRDKINICIAEWRFTEASILINEFEKNKTVRKTNVLRQFVEMTRAILLNGANSGSHPDFPDMLLNALKITYPQFDECKIDRYYFTFTEVAIINQYAGHFGEIGDLKRSTSIYDRLRRNLSNKIFDEDEKTRLFSTIMFNYSTMLGRMEDYEGALTIIDEGERFERNLGCLIQLPSFAYNKGFNLFESGKKAECIPYFALAYYGTSLFGKHGQNSYLDTMKKCVEKRLGFVFA
ncbi:MAG: transcriptional regulator [Oscillospiraceae bacterium]|nr:transcriptional regulator [Oscillospiraceae bacterium]